MKEKLFGKTLDELTAVTKRLGLPGYTARQLADWLYKKDINSIDEMSNLSKRTREILSNDYEYGLSVPVSASESSDGTKKYLYNVLNDKYIEQPIFLTKIAQPYVFLHNLAVKWVAFSA